MSKTILVFGALGSQGGSVVQALLRRKEQFRVRAATRRPSSDAAQALAAAGCEIVEASYGDRASLERAMAGVHGVWFITSFWDSGEGTAAAEVKLGQNVALAAAAAGVRHCVYSTLESPAAMGSAPFPTFDAKVGVEQELMYAGVPSTFVQVAWYYNNLENNTHGAKHSGWYPWPRDQQGRYVINVPISAAGLHAINSHDVGEACANIFAAPDRFIGRKVALSGELLTPASVLRAFQAVFPETDFAFKNGADDMEEFKQQFGDVLTAMYSWYLFRMPAGGDLELSRQLNPGIQSLEAYLRANKALFVFEQRK